MRLKVQLIAAAPRGFGKTRVLSICRNALESADYKVTAGSYGENTESLVVDFTEKSNEEKIEFHQNEIARLSAELGII